VRGLDPKLAADLERVIGGAGSDSDKGGVASQYE